VNGLTPSQKGAIAEAEIAAAATRAGILILRPDAEGRRYDLVFDTGPQLLRVQCKWGSRKSDVIAVRTSTCRHTPLNGYLRTIYSADEIDAFAVYCPDTSISASRPPGTTRRSALQWPTITGSGL
jgi:hypothetical protein